MNFKASILPFALASVALLSLPSQAVVFGPQDTRQELYQLPAEWQIVAQATVAIVPMQKFGKISKTQWQTFVRTSSLGKSTDYTPLVSPKHPYSNQPVFADCSGFMIAQDIMITASHCLPDTSNPAAMYFYVVAGLAYGSQQATQVSAIDLTVSDDNVTQVKEVLYRGTPSTSSPSNTDFAILRLKKPLFSITPMALNSNPVIAAENPIAAFGYVFGVPLKSTISGTVAQDTDATDTFMLNFADSGSGGSGGPVLDVATKSVVAIHVAGQQDWRECGDDEDEYVTWSCESHRPTSTDQIDSDPSISRRTKRQFHRMYPDGVITGFANHDLKIGQVADKLTELNISFKKL